MEIITATTADLDLLTPMFGAYRQCYEQISDVAEERQFLHDRITKDQSVILVAKVDGVGAGFIVLFPSYSSVSMKKIYIFTDLYVDPAYRKQGIAKELMNEAIKFASKTSSTGLVIETRISNQSASKLFYDVGFQKDGDRMYYYLEF